MKNGPPPHELVGRTRDRGPARQRPPAEAALLLSVHHHLFNFVSQLSEMGGERLVKLVLLRVRRASRDLLGIVGFGAEFLRTGLHVLHGWRPR